MRSPSQGRQPDLVHLHLEASYSPNTRHLLSARYSGDEDDPSKALNLDCVKLFPERSDRAGHEGCAGGGLCSFGVLQKSGTDVTGRLVERRERLLVSCLGKTRKTLNQGMRCGSPGPT
jgi:hypothetical protein